MHFYKPYQIPIFQLYKHLFRNPEVYFQTKNPAVKHNAVISFCFRALTEKIVSVLPKMKCPHRLEPHQIQGLDFIHIFPVVQVMCQKCKSLPQVCSIKLIIPCYLTLFEVDVFECFFFQYILQVL